MGYSAVNTVLSPAASYVLTDLATVKDELSIDANDTSNDTWLTRAITQVSWSIGSYIKRVVAPEYVQDVFDIEQDAYPWQTPGGFPALELTRWPVMGVTSVVQTRARCQFQTLHENRGFRRDPKTGFLLRLNHFTGVVTSWEAIPVTVTYTAGYGQLVQETDTVPEGAPYTVTVAKPATFSCPQSVAYANGTALELVSANPAQGQFSVSGQGVYAFNAADAGQALNFAYATVNIPADLVDACLQLITSRYAARGRDPSLIQQDTAGIGMQRWWFGGAPGQSGAFPPDIEAILDNYRVPTIA